MATTHKIVVIRSHLEIISLRIHQVTSDVYAGLEQSEVVIELRCAKQWKTVIILLFSAKRKRIACSL